jgi:predicted CoA-binding protein
MDEDARIAAILRRVRTVAVVGASNKPERPSYGVMRFLQAHGFTAAAPDMVDVFRASDQVGPVVDSAIALGVGVVWMQLGVVDEAAAARARAAGIEVVMDRCPAIEWARLGLDDVSRVSG